MSMHGGGGGGGGGRMGLRSMRTNRYILEHKIKKGTLPRILTYAKHYRALLVVFLTAVILDAVVSSVSPLLFRGILDNAIPEKSKSLVITLASLGAGLSMFERRTSAVIGEGLIYDLRAKVFSHIQEMPIAFFSRTQTGALISRLNNDVIGAQQAFTDLFSNVVGNVILVTIVIGTLFQRGMELNAEMNMVMSERFNVSGAMLVKLFGRPRDEREFFENRAGQVRDIGIHQAMYQRFFFIALSLTAALATAFAYGFGGVEVINKVIQPGTLVALTLYLVRLYGPLTQLSNLNIDYMSAMVSFERLFEVLDLEPMIKESPDAVVIPDGPAELVFDHVDFSYPGAQEVSLASLKAVARLDDTPRTDVLHDVSFRVEPGTMTALVGPSGAGKTTISMLVSRLYDVDEGSVSINGLDLRDATTASLNATVGVVTQDSHLFHDTLRANLAFAKPDASDEEIATALASAQIADLVA